MNSLKNACFAWLLIGWLVGFCAIPADAQNTPPAISPIANRTVNEDTFTGPIIFNVQDAETPAANLIVEAVSSNPQLVPSRNITIGGTGSFRYLQMLPAPNQFGTTIITTVVRDSDGASAASSFILTVTAVNDPPISGPLLSAPQREGDILRFTFTGEPAYDYFVEFSDLLSPSASWQTLTNFRAKLQPIEAIVTDSVGKDGSRFYRIRKQDCQCE
jgi:hypothetical protein